MKNKQLGKLEEGFNNLTDKQKEEIAKNKEIELLLKSQNAYESFEDKENPIFIAQALLICAQTTLELTLEKVGVSTEIEIDQIKKKTEDNYKKWLLELRKKEEADPKKIIEHTLEYVYFAKNINT